MRVETGARKDRRLVKWDLLKEQCQYEAAPRQGNAERKLYTGKDMRVLKAK